MTTLPRSTVLAVLLAATPATIVHAQAPARSENNACFRARPAPECRVFFVTSIGGYRMIQTSSSPFRAIADWGVMVNASPRHAYGGSWYVTMDHGDNFTTGPVVRYRRWFERNRSLDVALGTAVAGSLKAGSVLGLVKYNPVPWFGVGVRPEYLHQRRSVFCCFPSPTTTEYTATTTRVYVGVEYALAPGTGAPQEPASLVLGSRIRINEAGASNARLLGTVISAGADTVVLRLDSGGEAVPFSHARISRLEVSRGLKRHIGAGMGLGFLAGAGTGALLVASDCSDDYLCPLFALFGAGIGGGAGIVVGGVIGALRKTEKWDAVPSSRWRVSTRPAGPGNFALTLSAQF